MTIYPNSTMGANVFLMQSVPANSWVIYEEKQLVIHDKSARKKEAMHDGII